jgi:hypothetical protein
MRLLISLVVVLAPTFSYGTTGGPDYLMVRDVSVDDTLQIRSEPYPGAKAIGALAPDAKRIPNLECLETIDLVHYLKSQNASSRTISRVKPGESWCKIRHPHMPTLVGWVNARFVKADSIDEHAPEALPGRESNELAGSVPKPPVPQPSTPAEAAASNRPTDHKDEEKQSKEGQVPKTNKLKLLTGMPVEDALAMHSSFGPMLHRVDHAMVGCRLPDVAQRYTDLSRKDDEQAKTFASTMIKQGICTDIPESTVVQIGRTDGSSSQMCMKPLSSTECLWVSIHEKLSDIRDLVYTSTFILTGKHPREFMRITERHLQKGRYHVIAHNDDREDCQIDEVFIDQNDRVNPETSRRYKLSRVEHQRGIQRHTAPHEGPGRGPEHFVLTGEASYCVLHGSDLWSREERECSNEMKIRLLSSYLSNEEIVDALRQVYTNFCRSR